MIMPLSFRHSHWVSHLPEETLVHTSCLTSPRHSQSGGLQHLLLLLERKHSSLYGCCHKLEAALLTSRGFIVNASLAGAVLPCAAAVAVGGAAEVGGVRVTGGGAAILQGELRPAPPIIPHAPRADHTWGPGACVSVRQQQGPGGGCGHRGGGGNIVTVPATMTIGLTTRGERGTKQPHVLSSDQLMNIYM